MSQWLPIADIATKVKAGELKATDLVEQALKTIEEKRDYNAIISTTEARARERAAKIDAGENHGRLAGVPFIAKDNFLAFGAETTAASNILKGFVAPYQATAIERLEAEGAICVAKANLDAFAHGASTENSDYGVTKNPHDISRVPGGSSGGSAAAVVLDMAPFALGTDTGGSIRQPSSFCGCVGYKPTYGLISRSGVVAMGSSLDIVGPLTRSVTDSTTSQPTVTSQPITPVAEAALEGLLLSPDQINTAMGATGMTVTGGTATVMADDSAHVADKACRPMNDAATAAAYAGSGWSALRGRRLQEPGSTLTYIVDQGVVLFSSAHDAGAFFTASAQSWPACSNRQYTYTAAGQPDQVFTVGPVSNTNGTLSATSTQGGGNSIWTCQRALTVANNVAIDVAACSFTQSDAAVNIAHQIAAKVPT